jgi:hypothetical protein
LDTPIQEGRGSLVAQYWSDGSNGVAHRTHLASGDPGLVQINEHIGKSGGLVQRHVNRGFAHRAAAKAVD